MRKLLLILGLVFVTQFQPLQVHALALTAEQAGHSAGQLTHSHAHDPASAVDADSDTGTSGHSHDGDLQHASQCHPGHVLFPAVDSPRVVNHADAPDYREPLKRFMSAELSPDTPPPRLPG